MQELEAQVVVMWGHWSCASNGAGEGQRDGRVGHTVKHEGPMGDMGPDCMWGGINFMHSCAWFHPVHDTGLGKKKASVSGKNKKRKHG